MVKCIRCGEHNEPAERCKYCDNFLPLVATPPVKTDLHSYRNECSWNSNLHGWYGYGYYRLKQDRTQSAFIGNLSVRKGG